MDSIIRRFDRDRKSFIENLKTGFAFTLNGVGAFSFQVYVDGNKITCADFNQTLKAYDWHHLVATVNSTTKEVNLYKNGELISSSYFFGKGVINTGANDFMIGKSFANTYTDVFRTNTINGLVDDIRIFSRVLTGSELTNKVPEHVADLSVAGRVVGNARPAGFRGALCWPHRGFDDFAAADALAQGVARATQPRHVGADGGCGVRRSPGDAALGCSGAGRSGLSDHAGLGHLARPAIAGVKGA